MREFYFTLLVLQVAGLAYTAVVHSREARRDSHHQTSERLRRQAGGSTWVTGAFSECSVTCGGGIRVRSVRCLDEDGVISSSCSEDSAPSSFEFCSQVNCTTRADDPSLLPDNGASTFSMPNATVNFVSTGPGTYDVTNTIDEPDGTKNNIQDMITPTGNSTTRRITGSMPAFETDDNNNFLVNRSPVINLNDVERTEIPTGETIQLMNGKIVLSNGTEVAPDVDTLTYYDGFTFYPFNTSTVNPFNGPGTLYYNPNTRQALYSIVPPFNIQIDALLMTSPPPTDSPIDGPSSPPPDTTAPPPETTVPPPETTIPPPETTVPPPETTVPPPETTASPPDTTAPPPDTTTPPQDTTAPPPDTTVLSLIVVTTPSAITSPPLSTLLPTSETSPSATPEAEVEVPIDDLCDRTRTQKKSKKSRRRKSKKKSKKRRRRKSKKSKKRKPRKARDPCEEDAEEEDEDVTKTTKKSRRKGTKSKSRPKSKTSRSSRTTRTRRRSRRRG